MIFGNRDPFDVIIDFKFKEFENEEEIIKYIKSPDYMIAADKPGICFGYQIIENSGSDFEVKLHLSDESQDPEGMGIADQK